MNRSSSNYQELKRSVKEPLSKKTSYDTLAGFVSNLFSNPKSSNSGGGGALVPGKNEGESSKTIDLFASSHASSSQSVARVENPRNEKPIETLSKWKDSSGRNKHSSSKEREGMNLIKKFSLKSSPKTSRAYKSQKNLHELVREDRHSPSCSVWKWKSNEALSDTVPLCERNSIVIAPKGAVRFSYKAKDGKKPKKLSHHKRAQSFDLQVLFENEELVITPKSYSLEDVFSFDNEEERPVFLNDSREEVKSSSIPTQSVREETTTTKVRIKQSSFKKSKKHETVRSDKHKKNDFHYSVGQSKFLKEFNDLESPQRPKQISLVVKVDSSCPPDLIKNQPNVNQEESSSSPPTTPRRLPSPTDIGSLPYLPFDASQATAKEKGISKLLGIFQTIQVR